MEVHCTQQSGFGTLTTAPLLGILVTVVDEVASDFVFGSYGTAGRPKGVMDVSLIHSLDRAKQLTSPCQSRWLIFLQRWQAAGWDVTSLVEFAYTLRPLQYRVDVDEQFVRGVTKELLHHCIDELYTLQGFTKVMRSDLEDFLDIVHSQFSRPGAVLLPAIDAAKRLLAWSDDLSK